MAMCLAIQYTAFHDVILSVCPLLLPAAPAPTVTVTVTTVTPGAALQQWPQGPVIILMEAVAVLCMPRGCTRALLFIGDETLREVPSDAVLTPTQAQAHMGHRRIAAAVTAAPAL